MRLVALYPKGGPKMSSSTPIANMLRSMLADGVDHDAIVRAVEAAEKQLPIRDGNATTRGMRLSVDWTPLRDHVDYAIEKGLTREQIALEAEKFRNYWTAKTGNAATKRDWSATWRNWIITAVEQRHAATRHRRGHFGDVRATGRSQSGANAVLAGMGRLARRLDETRNAAGSDRQVAADVHAPRLLGFDEQAPR
jgi:hypothetical protein